MKILCELAEIAFTVAMGVCAITAACLMVVGAAGLALAFGLCFVWDWVEDIFHGN